MPKTFRRLSRRAARRAAERMVDRIIRDHYPGEIYPPPLTCVRPGQIRDAAPVQERTQ